MPLLPSLESLLNRKAVRHALIVFLALHQVSVVLPYFPLGMIRMVTRPHVY